MLHVLPGKVKSSVKVQQWGHANRESFFFFFSTIQKELRVPPLLSPVTLPGGSRSERRAEGFSACLLLPTHYAWCQTGGHLFHICF